jgi:hypothetical protein
MHIRAHGAANYSQVCLEPVRNQPSMQQLEPASQRKNGAYHHPPAASLDLPGEISPQCRQVAQASGGAAEGVVCTTAYFCPTSKTLSVHELPVPSALSCHSNSSASSSSSSTRRHT